MIGKEPPATHQRWMAVVLGLMLLAVAAASTLKYAREHTAPAVAPPDRTVAAM